MKSLRIYLIAGAVLLVLYVVMEYNRPKPTDWTPTYYNTHKKPFGTYVLYNHINDILPGAKVTPRRGNIRSVLADSAYKNSAYIIICPEVQMSPADYAQLTRYLSAGNDVFIAAANFGRVLENKLKVSADNGAYSDFNIEYIGFVNPAVDAERQYYVDKGFIDGYFTGIDTAKATVVGNNSMGMANLVRYNFGSGRLFLSANPQMFTNYSLLKTQGGQYASVALSHLKQPGQIIWDEYFTQGSSNNQSPMRVFFNNPSLRWAYYIAILGLLVFVVYGIKRRQRIIPVVTPLPNTTLEFVNVVGQVYYERRDNLDIAHKKILYFLAMVREKYLLKTTQLDEGFAQALAKKTAINSQFIVTLINYFNYIGTQQQVNDYELMELNRLIEKFKTLSV